MKFNIIVADPPWGGWKDNLSMSDVKRGANANYNTMTIDQIKAIPVKSITSSDGALVAIWVPSSIDAFVGFEKWVNPTIEANVVPGTPADNYGICMIGL